MRILIWFVCGLTFFVNLSFYLSIESFHHVSLIVHLPSFFSVSSHLCYLICLCSLFLFSLSSKVYLSTFFICCHLDWQILIIRTALMSKSVMYRAFHISLWQEKTYELGVLVCARVWITYPVRLPVFRANRLHPETKHSTFTPYRKLCYLFAPQYKRTLIYTHYTVRVHLIPHTRTPPLTTHCLHLYKLPQTHRRSVLCTMVLMVTLDLRPHTPDISEQLCLWKSHPVLISYAVSLHIWWCICVCLYMGQT